jgi:hypothetical protein
LRDLGEGIDHAGDVDGARHVELSVGTDVEQQDPSSLDLRAIQLHHRCTEEEYGERLAPAFAPQVDELERRRPLASLELVREDGPEVVVEELEAR